MENDGKFTRDLIEMDLDNIKSGYKAEILVVAIRLPSGSLEVISNTTQIASKLLYYLSAYDDNLCLRANPKVQILGYLLI